MHSCRHILTVSFLAFFLAHPAPAKVVYVSQGATGNGSGSSWENACTTITAGVVASATGDEIWVKSATYPEAIDMKEGVALYGGFPVDGSPSFDQRDWRANETIIDATGLNTHAVVGADLAALDGFTITGGLAGRGGGIYCTNASPYFANCTITANQAQGEHPDGSGGGVYCLDSSPSFASCRIIANRDVSAAGGLYFAGDSSPVMINCVVAGNRSDSGAGGVCLSPSSTLRNCTLADNRGSSGDGAVAGGDDSTTLVNCILWNVNGEMPYFFEGTLTHCCVRGSWPGEGNFGADPEFVNPEAGDYRLRNGSRCIDRGLVSEAPSSDLDGRTRPGGDGKVDIGAYESPDEYEPTPSRVYYVRADASPGGDGSSWDTAFESIQLALNAAEALDEVWVAQGTYLEVIELIPDRAVYGGFTGVETARDQRDWVGNATVIDATGKSAHAVTGQHQSIIDGFTVIGQRSETLWFRTLYGTFGTVENCMLTGPKGSQIRGSPVLINCTITGCSDTGLRFVNAASTLINCTISDNLGSGIFFSQPVSTGTLRNCTIKDNLYDGVICKQSHVKFERCVVMGNSRSGVFSYESQLTLLNCTLANNQSDGLSAFPTTAVHQEYPVPFEDGCAQYSPVLENCLLTGNAEYGVHCYRTTPVLVNCTIADNTRGGVYVERNHYTLSPYYGDPYWECEGFPSLTNCVVWNNNAVEVIWKYYQQYWEDNYDYYEFIRDETPPPGQGLEMTYSCAQGGWPDVGNTDASPLFLDPGSGDYHLQPGSPCIDRASTTGPGLDLDGHLRPVDIPGVGRDGPGAYDMGTYEFASVPPTPTPTMTSTPTLSPTPTNTPGPATPTPTALPSTTPIPGDINSDGTVNHTDLLLFQEHWHKSVTPIPTL